MIGTDSDMREGLRSLADETFEAFECPRFPTRGETRGGTRRVRGETRVERCGSESRLEPPTPPMSSNSHSSRPASSRVGREIDVLASLPPELVLLILARLKNYADCANLALASPRLGLAGLRADLPRFRDPLFAVARAWRESAAHGSDVVAMHVSEKTLRKYAADARATEGGVEWLYRLSPVLHIRIRKDAPNHSSPMVRWIIVGGVRGLVRADDPGCLVRGVCSNGTVNHYEGERSAVRLVRSVAIRGHTRDFEGPWGSERLVCDVFPNGNTAYYEGAKGSERLVRKNHSKYGDVEHYEGAKGSEHLVRVVFLSGNTKYYKGAKGSERTVRIVFPNGNAAYYEGAKGSERLVRVVFPNSSVHYYEGAKGSEHIVCVVYPSGHIYYYEGAKGSEHIVRIDFPNGNTQYYEGAKGSVRLVRRSSTHS